MTRSEKSKRSLQTGFTLVEMMVVIGIIVLLATLSVPAFRFLSGSRSIEGAQNQIAAVLGRARASAIGLQKVFGVFFFIDPATDQVSVAIVSQSDTPTSGSPAASVYLDIAGSRDDLVFPSGISVQAVDDAAIASGVRTDDGYVGFNVVSGTRVKYGPVILFDGNGRLLSTAYGFRTADANNAATQMGVLFCGVSATPPAFLDPGGAGNTPPQAETGLVLLEREMFAGQGFTLDDIQVTNPGGLPAAYVAVGANGKSEKDEEDWLDQNATVLLINRNSGSLMQSE